MSISDIIQTGILIVLAVTLIAICNSLKAQWQLLQEQKKLTASELLRGRYEMFFSAWDVTKEDVRQFKEKPHLFIDPDKMSRSIYRSYKKDDDAVKDYLLIVQLYEYLAFAHTLNTSPDYLGPESKPDDPYGKKWVERWIEILNGDKDFQHVHDSYKDDHLTFHNFVEDVRRRKKLPPTVPRFCFLREDKPTD